MGKFNDLSGKRFDRLTVLKRAPDHVTSGGQHVTMYECQCDCGNIFTVRYTSLMSGRTHSCGCYKHEKQIERNTTHGGKYDRLYKVWQGIKTRCYNKNFEHYDKYGGRGITMCEEWKNDYAQFKEWAMMNGYDPEAQHGKCTLDRINNNKGYNPDNCRWVDMREQNLNKRSNHLIEYKGKNIPLATLAKELNIEYNSLYYQIATCGKSLEEVVKS